MPTKYPDGIDRTRRTQAVLCDCTHYLRTKSWRAFRFIGSVRKSGAAACIGILLTVLAYVMIPALATANPASSTG